MINISSAKSSPARNSAMVLKVAVSGLAADRENGSSPFAMDLDQGNIDAQTLLKRYCHSLYRRCGTYGEVARRTVKKYISDYNRNSGDA